MASHDISFTIPQKMALAKDIEFSVKSDGKKLGTLLISKGNIEWVPASNSVKKHRLTWERFAALMADVGSEARISKRSPSAE